MCLNGILETAVENGLCEHNPAHKVKIESTATPVSYTHLDVYKRQEISTGTAQTAYELQTSSNMGGQYTTRSTAETDASSFATPAGQFAQGTLMWRVRTKNGDGVWGSYSAAATIIIRRAPVVPVIVYTLSLIHI